jgi:hypothetical protein
MINTGFHEAPDLDPGELWQVIVLSTPGDLMELPRLPLSSPAQNSDSCPVVARIQHGYKQVLKRS